MRITSAWTIPKALKEAKELGDKGCRSVDADRGLGSFAIVLDPDGPLIGLIGARTMKAAGLAIDSHQPDRGRQSSCRPAVYTPFS